MATIEISIGISPTYFSSLQISNEELAEIFEKTFQNEPTPGFGTFDISSTKVEILNDSFQVFEPESRPLTYNTDKDVLKRIALTPGYAKDKLPSQYYYPLPPPSKETSIIAIMLTNFEDRVDNNVWPGAQLEIAKRLKGSTTDDLDKFSVGKADQVLDKFDSESMKQDNWRGFFTRIRSDFWVNKDNKTNTYQTYDVPGDPSTTEDSFVYTPLECYMKKPYMIPCDPCVFIKPESSFWDERDKYDFFLRIRKPLEHQFRHNFADYQMWYGSNNSILPQNENRGVDAAYNMSMTNDVSHKNQYTYQIPVMSMLPDNGIPVSMKVGYLQYFLDKNGFKRIFNTEGDVARTLIRLTIPFRKECKADKNLYLSTLKNTRSKKKGLLCDVYTSEETLKDECSANNACGAFLYSKELYKPAADKFKKDFHVGCLFPFQTTDDFETDEKQDLSFTQKKRSCVNSLKYVMSEMSPNEVAYDQEGKDLIPNAEFESKETAITNCVSDINCIGFYKNAKSKYVLAKGLLRSVEDVDVTQEWKEKKPDFVQEEFHAKLFQNTLCTSMGCESYGSFRKALHDNAIVALNKIVSTKKYLLFPKPLVGEMYPSAGDDDVGYKCNWIRCDFRISSIGSWGLVGAKDMVIQVCTGDHSTVILRRQIILQGTKPSTPVNPKDADVSSIYKKEDQYTLNGFTFVDLRHEDKEALWFGNNSTVYFLSNALERQVPKTNLNMYGTAEQFFVSEMGGIKSTPGDIQSVLHARAFGGGVGYVNLRLEHFPRTESDYVSANGDPPTAMELFNKRGIHYVNGYILLGDSTDTNHKYSPYKNDGESSKELSLVLGISAGIVFFLLIIFVFMHKRRK